MMDLERQWYIQSARKLIAERGEDDARLVMQYQRKHAPEYAAIIEAELEGGDETP